MAAKSSFAFLGLFFSAGALLLMFLVLLAGVSDHQPLNLIYFLQADTGNIPNAAPLSRWTLWNLCSVTPGNKNDCGSVHPAFPFDPPSHRNFDTKVNIPEQFIGTRKYFYLSRFMFAFYLISLFFAVMALFTGLLALCSRIGSYLSGFLNMVALFWWSLTSALMTATYVLGRDNFRKNRQSAQIGKYAFGFMWGAWACLLLAIVFVCMAGKGSRDKSSYGSSGKRSFGFRGKRSKSTRSRGSFVEGRIKDDYA